MSNVTPIFSDDGRNGVNRGIGRNMLGVDTDAEAIAIFLKQHEENSQETYRAYHREIDRLVQWATFVQKKPISSLLPDDFEAYARFIRNPPKQWCNNTRFFRGKPFNGPLSVTSQRHAFAVIGSLLNFLKRHGYLHSIPMFKTNVVRRPNPEVMRRRVRERQLNKLQRQALFTWLDSQNTFDATRARFAICLMFFLGLRINEVATHRMSHFACVRERWVFQVTGKGNKYEELGVPDQMLKELERYRQAMKLEGPVEKDEHSLMMDHDLGAIGVRRISQIVKDAVVSASALLQDDEAKETMRACSAHWFRHMFASRQADMGVRIEDLKKNARHAKVETTYLYVDSNAERRHAAIQNMTMDLDDAL